MPQYMTGRPRSTRGQFHLGNQKLLRAATPEELEQWSDASNEDSYFSDDLIDLDEGRPYIFEKGDAAWVRTTKGTWCLGTVTTSPPRVGPTRDGDGLFYSVIFTLGGARMKKSFAPLNGDMKPDHREIRDLLSTYGWLDC
ncbi:hypothetical protein AGABI1DRAFT_115433 [Agaricus bisporus var. burnettii JB137-S8]|uniref:Uncharacterized protein n=2 Tax=Agaricus bisporus var. burnettii TaxID=192524 RepID=K5VR80_AGABU|nr:hypothetical protein AGABI2DRAFT_190114 [Agaricus bisporus var. bisporus H97]XP_007332281.1 uncharacterized protein AGABI1DRAFT_115433 [Agaricus bisporus var. burnettii JB137-S8]EKM76974.1 hypothetical protein AGABI1DRAFT_115433 [Agaricus bisporus var. burnettii JB137-S8]EKV51970.1 hypothetical protein AGABI2DRAFT_190114 [Agaricus bisporus var. bisporus H97]KAF7784841.1 hypothetical protein Agabi119p4_1006 [Agaricus bisporus var. burnettii]